MTALLEGPVSRYLNRRVSVPVARALARTPATPNQVSVAALALAAAAAALIAAGRNIEGGVLVQVSSIADGVDGDLARAKMMTSRFGGVFDSVLDRYADALIAVGLAWYAHEHEHHDGALVVGLAAAVAFLLVSYSRSRLEATGGAAVAGDLLGFASRDVRLFALALGSIAGQAFWTLVAVGALSYATVAWRLWMYRRRANDGESS